ncbi:MAG: hypothetical protein AAF211_01445 [Myxococcota bacterium]
MSDSQAEALFWQIAAELQAEDERVVEGTIMNGRCLRVGKEFLVFREWVSVPEVDAEIWRGLLREGIAFVG